MSLRRIWKDNSLSIVMGLLFLFSIAGHALTGWRKYDEDQKAHHAPAVSFSGYLLSSSFLESVFENWEGEFLQMAAFLALSAFLKQRGSAESSKPKDEQKGAPDESGRDPRDAVRPSSPGPVHRGGWALKLYSHSLSLALFALFLFCFALHWVSGAKAFNADQLQHGDKAISMLAFIAQPTFWFESFQNWQSEFLSTVALVVLSIWLREKGSPESKPVQAPNRQTGENA